MSLSKNNDPIVIVAAQRTPMGKFSGYFKTTPAPQLMAPVIQAMLKNIHLDPEQIDSVLLGCVLPAGLGQAPARQAALLAGLHKKTPCVTINKVCGSSLQTIIFGYDGIMAESHQIIVAGGMENMSCAPYLLPNERFGKRLGHGQVWDHMMLDGLEDAYSKENEKSMGHFAEKCAEKYGISRELQDDFAKESIRRARHAINTGLFAAEITPLEIKSEKGEIVEVNEDEAPFSVDPEKVSKLKPAFKKEGTVTAANSSSIADGAAGLILMRLSTAEQLSLKPLAMIMGHYTHAQEPEWFTTAPIGAVTGLLGKIGWNMDVIDLFEINEAFAVVPLVTMQALHIPHDKVNVHGGACILGHPLGASGARILVTLLHALREHQLKRGIATLCIGGGEAVAIAIETLT